MSGFEPPEDPRAPVLIYAGSASPWLVEWVRDSCIGRSTVHWSTHGLVPAVEVPSWVVFLGYRLGRGVLAAFASPTQVIRNVTSDGYTWVGDARRHDPERDRLCLMLRHLYRPWLDDPEALWRAAFVMARSLEGAPLRAAILDMIEQRDRLYPTLARPVGRLGKPR